jgi:hypothetical protein
MALPGGFVDRRHQERVDGHFLSRCDVRDALVQRLWQSQDQLSGIVRCDVLVRRLLVVRVHRLKHPERSHTRLLGSFFWRFAVRRTASKRGTRAMKLRLRRSTQSRCGIETLPSLHLESVFVDEPQDLSRRLLPSLAPTQCDASDGYAADPPNLARRPVRLGAPNPWVARLVRANKLASRTRQ